MERQFHGVIYVIKNKINKKMYIGQTIRKGGFKERYYGNIEKYTHNKHLHSSIKKYGLENFSIDEEFDKACCQDELDKLEKMYIKIYNTTDKRYGYNKKVGGMGGKFTDETRREFASKVSKPVVNLNDGRIYHSIIYAYNNTKDFVGRKRCRKFVKLSNVKCKLVVCTNDNMVFTNITRAANYYGIQRSSVSNSLRKNSKCRKDQNWLMFKNLTEYIFEVDYKNEFILKDEELQIVKRSVVPKGV